MTSSFPRWLVLTTLVVAATVCTLSWYVGRTGDGEFNWELAAVFGTAVGTTLLAVTTGGLAYLTGRDVNATRELARLQRDDQLARERPTVLLLNAGYAERGSNEPAYVSVSLQNVGLGPAVNIRVQAKVTTPHEVVITPPFRLAAVGPGDTAGCRISVELCHGVGSYSEAQVEISGTYTDRRRMEQCDVLTDTPTGPTSLGSEPEE